MKPEELDDLFRRGLAEQHAPPRPSAWAAVQQRMAAADTSGEADELPAFLLTPSVAPPPFMTASRGGKPLVAATTTAWWQRPALRAAAAVVLAVGGGALLLTPDADRPAEPAVTLNDLKPAALAPAAVAPVVGPAATPVAVAVATPAPALPPVESIEQPRSFAPAPVHGAGVAAPQQRPPVVAATTRRPATRPGAPAVRRAVPAAAVAAKPTALDSQMVAYRPGPGRPAAPNHASSLTVGEAADATLAARAAQAAHGFVNVPREALPEATSPEMEAAETLEMDGGIGQFVARATGRPARVLSPNALLRRGAGRVRALLDRADRDSDGQLTLRTTIAGQPVRKTISL